MGTRVGYVPLPEVAEHSNGITVGELGLPVGFDIEQLELHVGRTERISRFCDFGTLAIRGYSGETTEYTYGVGGTSSEGTAFITKAILQRKAPLYNGYELGHPEGGLRRYQWSHGEVKINNAEVEERIKNDGDKWNRGVFDAQARAKYMDMALRKGIVGVANDSRFENGVANELGVSALHHLAGTIFWAPVAKYFAGFTTETALAYFTFVESIDPILLPVLDKLMHRGDGEKIQRTTSVRKHYDRLLIAAGLAKTTRLIRARS